MSYSFSVSGANKDEAKENVNKQFDTIVQQQPAHLDDRDAAQQCVEAFIDALGDPTGSQRIHVAAYGSLSQQFPDNPDKRSNSSLSVNVSVSLA